jgi:hypothetical protein
MLTLLAGLGAYFEPLTVFRYITFRTGGATWTALTIVLWFGAVIAGKLRTLSPLIGQRATNATVCLVLAFSVVVSTLLWARLDNAYVWSAIIVALGFAMTCNDRFLRDAYLLIAAMVALAAGFLAFLAANAIFAKYLHLLYVPGIDELAVVCGALFGAILGLLRAKGRV